MTAISDVVADLVATPRPVLCLDTCDLLSIVQCLKELQAGYLTHVRRLLDKLDDEPQRLQIVLTYLVQHEWTQNVANVRQQAEAFLSDLDKRTVALDLAWSNTLGPVPSPAPTHAGSDLPRRLVDLALSVMTRAVILEHDDGCIDRALSRVMDKRRPSHRGEIKDSIHLEHYLELTTRLRASGFTKRCLFVSTNRSDFWDGQRAHAHPDLVAEFATPNLEFFGTLEAGLGQLGI